MRIFRYIMDGRVCLYDTWTFDYRTSNINGEFSEFTAAVRKKQFVARIYFLI